MRFILIFILVIFSSFVFSQTKEALIRKGNKLYKKGDYSQAEVDYLKSLQKNKYYNKGLFNLGDAYYKEKNYQKAGNAYLDYSSNAHDKSSISKAYYNLGNSLFQAGKYQDCIKAYENSLINNPNDRDAKYNLSLALRMLKQQKQQNKQNKQNQDKNKSQKQKQQQQQQKKQQEQQKKQQQQQANQNEKKLTKRDADRMLQALNKDEENVLKNVEKQNVKVPNVKIEKDW